jgi:hypothetical protein
MSDCSELLRRTVRITEEAHKESFVQNSSKSIRRCMISCAEIGIGISRGITHHFILKDHVHSQAVTIETYVTVIAT